MTKFGRAPRTRHRRPGGRGRHGCAFRRGRHDGETSEWLAAGNLMNASARVSANSFRSRSARPDNPRGTTSANACATGATALRNQPSWPSRPGRWDYGLAVGVEKLAGAGLLQAGAKKKDADTWTPGPVRSGAPIDGRIGTETDAGRLRPDRGRIRTQVQAAPASSCSPKISEREPCPLHPESACVVTKSDSPSSRL